MSLSKFKAKLPWRKGKKDAGPPSVPQKTDQVSTVAGQRDEQRKTKDTPGPAQIQEVSQVPSEVDQEGGQESKNDPTDLPEVPKTSQIQPETGQDVRKAPPICELWNEAYEELKLKEDSLMKKYELILSGTAAEDPTKDAKVGRDKRRAEMEYVLKERIAEVEKNAWKLSFGSGESVSVKELADHMLKVLDFADDYITNALDSNPYASIAWAGVSTLLLPLLLNPSKQAVSLAEGLEYISNLTVRSLIREDLYHRRYESGEAQHRGSLPAHDGFRHSLKELYVRTLKFQAKSVCYYMENTAKRFAKDSVKWDSWDSLLKDIEDQENVFCAVNDLCKDDKYDSECLLLDQRHKESMKGLNSIGNDVSGLRKAIEDAQRDGQRTALLNWLSTIDPSENYNNARGRHKERTGDWLIKDNDEFKNWQNEPNSLLWLHGKAGSGKSILSSTVIEYLEESYDDDPQTALAYFYFSFSDTKKQDTPGMLSSLIKQLCCRRPDTPEPLQALIQYQKEGKRPDLKKVEKILAATFRGFSKVFIVVDALDECPYDSGERRVLLESLCRIQNLASENLHLLCTSRKEPDIERALNYLWSEPSKVAFDLSLHKEAVDADIGLYIDQELESPSYASWSIDMDIKTDVRATLIRKADGMFQYVSCQFEVLKESYTVSSIRKALKELPEGLDATYDRMLRNLDRKSHGKVLSLLKWLAFSERPLILEELAEASALDPYRPTPFDFEDRPLQPKDVLNYLRGLVTTTQIKIKRYSSVWHEHKAFEIRFAHFSIQEYLMSTRIRDGPAPASKFFISNDDAQLHLSASCLAYHFQISETEIANEENVKRLALWEYAVWYWERHLDKVTEASEAIILTKAMQVFTPGSPSLLNMIRIRDPDKSFETNYWKSSDDLAPLLYYAVSLDMYKMTTHLINNGADLNHFSSNADYGTALQAATYHDNQQIVKLLLDAGANVDVQGGGIYETALQAAASWGNLDIIKLLLEKGADVNAQGGEYGNALQAAAEDGNLDIMKLLLERGSDVNAQGGEYGNALQAAASRGNLDTIKLLLERGSDVNAQGGRYGNALAAAIFEEEHRAARLLISLGAKVDMHGQVEEEARQNLLEVWVEEYVNEGLERLQKFREDYDLDEDSDESSE